MATGFLLSGPDMLDRPLSAKGQIKKETKTIDSIQYVTQYTYDQNGNFKTMTYPSGRVITYNYSNDRAVNVLNNTVSLATSINYKPFGGMSSLTYGNGIAGTIGYDNQYRVASITAGTVMNLNYSQYDANGNITTITNAFDATKNKLFSYDALDRLSTATAIGIWGSLAWTYDGVGNRQTEGFNAYTYQPNTNKLNSANGKAYGYDNDGNTTAEGARVYTYNENQRLIRIIDTGVTKGEYTYNGNGQRVKKVVSGVTTIFHYSVGGLIIAESNSTGATTAEYVYLYGQPLGKVEETNVFYYHNDILGTPQKMTDDTSAIVWSAEYKPFGETTTITGALTNNLRFPGQYYDAETGLNYNYFRDYNPVIGRYVESDPLMDLVKVEKRSNRTDILRLFFRYTTLSSTMQMNEVKVLLSNRQTKRGLIDEGTIESIGLFAALRSPNILHGYLYVGNNPTRFTDTMGLAKNLECKLLCNWSIKFVTVPICITFCIPPSALTGPGIAPAEVVCTGLCTMETSAVTSMLCNNICKCE